MRAPIICESRCLRGKEVNKDIGKVKYIISAVRYFWPFNELKRAVFLEPICRRKMDEKGQNGLELEIEGQK